LFNIGRGRVIAQSDLIDSSLNGYPVYSSQTQNDGCLGFIETFDYNCEQITWTTDGVNAGTVFLRKGRYNCTNVCGTLQTTKDDCDIHFLTYYLQFATKFYKRPDTNGAKIMNGEMADIRVLLPRVEEQQTIVKYLDKKCAKIDAVITSKEEQNNLLKEQRQSIIYEVVTKGLNKNAPTKNSGVDWFGYIPESWNCKKIKYLLIDERDGIRIGPFGSSLKLDHLSELGTYKVYGQENLINDDFSLGDKYVDDEKFAELSNCELLPDDITVSMMGTIGKCSIVPQNIERGIMDSHLIRIRLDKEKISPKYFKLAFSENVATQQQLKLSSVGTIMSGLNSSIIKETLLIVPKLAEQQAITEYLDTKCAELDRLIQANITTINELKEYRESVIFETVTGKKEIC